MPAAPLPKNEKERLDTLDGYRLLDTEPEPRYDRIVELAANACGTPIALFTLLDKNRQWFKARVGLSAQETARDISFCAHAVASDELLIVEDAASDHRFESNVLVLKKPGIRFYAGVPVHGHNGKPIGTLCVVDVKPRSLSASQRLILEELATELELQIEIHRLSLQRRELVEERAVLTDMILHDAAGVVAVLGWQLEALRSRSAKDSEDLEFVLEAQKELTRMSQCMRVNNGPPRRLTVAPEKVDLRACLQQIATRLSNQVKHADMNFHAELPVPDVSVVTDPGLLTRILDNLVSNSVKACTSGARLLMSARLDSEDRLFITVEDDGPGIDPELADQIFDPYFSHYASGASGAGLGLSIARLAARALGGSVSYEALEPKGARFIVRIATGKLPQQFVQADSVSTPDNQGGKTQ